VLARIFEVSSDGRTYESCDEEARKRIERAIRAIKALLVRAIAISCIPPL
jgi:CRISPR/Cas system-associated protein Cas7 (RAMP superfamily)